MCTSASIESLDTLPCARKLPISQPQRQQRRLRRLHSPHARASPVVRHGGGKSRPARDGPDAARQRLLRLAPWFLAREIRVGGLQTCRQVQDKALAEHSPPGFVVVCCGLLFSLVGLQPFFDHTVRTAHSPHRTGAGRSNFRLGLIASFEGCTRHPLRA